MAGRCYCPFRRNSHIESDTATQSSYSGLLFLLSSYILWSSSQSQCELRTNITFLLCCHLCEMSIIPWPKLYDVQRNLQVHTYVCIFVFLLKIFLFLKRVFPCRYENLRKRLVGKWASGTKMFCILCYLINHGWLDVFYTISRFHLQ